MKKIMLFLLSTICFIPGCKSNNAVLSYNYKSENYESSVAPLESYGYSLFYNKFASNNFSINYGFRLDCEIQNLTTGGSSRCEYSIITIPNLLFANINFFLENKEENFYFEYDEKRDSELTHIKDEIYFVRADDGSYFADSSLIIARDYISYYNNRRIKSKESFFQYDDEFCMVSLDIKDTVKSISINSYGIPLQAEFDGQNVLYLRCEKKDSSLYSCLIEIIVKFAKGKDQEVFYLYYSDNSNDKNATSFVAALSPFESFHIS